MARRTIGVALFALLFTHDAVARYREHRSQVRMPDEWHARETIDRHQGALDFAKEMAVAFNQMRLDRKAEAQVRAQAETLNRQFEQGKKVVVFSVVRTEVSTSDMGDTWTDQGDPVYIGSGDSFEEVHDKFVLDRFNPKPQWRSDNGVRGRILQPNTSPSYRTPGSHYLIVTKNPDGSLSVERKYVYGNPYAAAKARQEARETANQVREHLDRMFGPGDAFWNRLQRELEAQEEQRRREAQRRQDEARERADRLNRERVRESRAEREPRAGSTPRERPQAEAPQVERPRREREKQRERQPSPPRNDRESTIEIRPR